MDAMKNLIENLLDLVSRMSPLSVLGILTASGLLAGYLLYLLLKEKKGRKQEVEEAKENKEEEKTPEYIQTEVAWSDVFSLLSVCGEFPYNSKLLRFLHTFKEMSISIFLGDFEKLRKAEIWFIPSISQLIHSTGHLLQLFFKNGQEHGRFAGGLDDYELKDMEKTEKCGWLIGVYLIPLEKGQDPFVVLKAYELLGVTANELLMAGLYKDNWKKMNLVCTATVAKSGPLALTRNQQRESPDLVPWDRIKNYDNNYVVGTKHRTF